MRIYKAAEVKSPRDFIKEIEVIDEGDEDSYALAIVNWAGQRHLAMRWNVARRERGDNEKLEERKICVGMPSSR
jgi:hypothetical protein